MGIFVHNLDFKFAKHLQPYKFGAITAIAPLYQVCKVECKSIFSSCDIAFNDATRGDIMHYGYSKSGWEIRVSKHSLIYAIDF